MRGAVHRVLVWWSGGMRLGQSVASQTLGVPPVRPRLCVTRVLDRGGGS